MKRFLASLFAVLAFVMPLLAQFTSDGYYRVQNFGTKRYLYVKDNTGSYDMHRDVGDFAAIQLWKTESMTVSDPSCLMYIKKMGTDLYDLTAQGTGIYAMVQRYVDVHQVTAGAMRGTYTVSATAAGITKYLSDNELSSVDRGTLGTGGNSPYRNWNVYAVSASGDTYFGITPNVQTGGKYYYPFYATFPFRLYSSGMKAYIISKVDRDLAVLSEVKDVVPALTPVLIECSSATPSGNRLDLTTSSASPLSGNEMKGVLFCNNSRPKSKDAITAYNASSMRVLGVTAAGKLGFVSESDNLVTYNGTRYLPANQAYLAVPADAPSELTIVTEEEYQQALAERSYTLTYLVDGKVFHTESHKAGEAITPQAAPEKEGHTFSGWSTIPTTMPASDYTVTGTFSPNTYTLTYMLDGAEYKKERVLYGTTITPQAAPVKEGYTFSGWTGLPATMPAHDVTVTGALSLNSYTLTYMVDGAVYATETHPFGERLTPLAAPEKEGHTFGGWSEIPATMPSHDVTVTGTFSVNSYTLTYMVDGEVYATETHAYGEALTPLPAPEKEGYTFDGWQNMMRSMPAHDVTVKGSFTINSYTLTVKNVERGISITAPNISVVGDATGAYENQYYLADNPAKYLPSDYSHAQRITTTGNKVSELIRKIPHQIDIEVAAVTLHAENLSVTRNYEIDVEYEVFAPISFGKEFRLVYRDTERGWADDIEDMEDVDFGYLQLTAKAFSDLPTTTTLKLTPIDENGMAIPQLEVDSISVPANANGADVAFTIKPGTGYTLNDILNGNEQKGVKKIDGVQYEARLAGTNSGGTLKRKAYMILRQMQVTIKGGVTIDAN